MQGVILDRIIWRWFEDSGNPSYKRFPFSNKAIQDWAVAKQQYKADEQNDNGDKPDN